MGTKASSRTHVKQSIINNGPVVTDEMKHMLNAKFSGAEVKDAIWSIDSGKAPGPDGFGSAFFKGAWEILGEDVYTAVLDFLNAGNLLKEINATNITLIPKGTFPGSVKDFRQISCCNVVCKCISN